MPLTSQPLVGARPSVLGALTAFSAICFAGAFLTDFVYWRSMSVTWETFSVWLIAAGLVIAGFAVLAGIAALIRGRHRGAAPMRWLRVSSGAIVIALSLVNAFVHSRDAYTAVVPDGLVLSAIVFVIMLVTAVVLLTMQRQRSGEIV